jgi:hypothetical protein
VDGDDEDARAQKRRSGGGDARAVARASAPRMGAVKVREGGAETNLPEARAHVRSRRARRTWPKKKKKKKKRNLARTFSLCSP